MRKPVSSHATVPEGSNAGVDMSNMEKAKKPKMPGTPMDFAQSDKTPVVAPMAKPPTKKFPPAAAPDPDDDAPKKPFPGAKKPFTSPDGENPPPMMAKKPGKQDNNISSKIPMAPAGAYPNQLPSLPVRNPKKPPVPPVQVGTPGVDDQSKRKAGKKR